MKATRDRKRPSQRSKKSHKAPESRIVGSLTIDDLNALDELAHGHCSKVVSLAEALDQALHERLPLVPSPEQVEDVQHLGEMTRIAARTMRAFAVAFAKKINAGRDS